MRAVLIPFRNTDEDRADAVRFILDRLCVADLSAMLASDWPQVPHGGTWVKAHAISNALASFDAFYGVRATSLAILDGDCIIPNLLQAFDVLDEGAPWVIPHTMVHRLTKDSTRAVLDGGPLVGQMEDPGPYIGYEGGGCTVLRRETWEQVPMDPRFLGWGHEDKAWSYALRCLVGEPVRLDGVCWHLWHPPQERLDRRVGSLESRALEWKYKAARKDPDAMGRLVAEAKESLRP